MGEDAGTQFHALIVCLEVATVLDNLALPIHIASIIHTYTKPPAAARILPAVPVDIDLYSVRTE
jgi:hypothetical protein